MSYRNNTLEYSATGRSPRVASSLSIFPGLGQIYNSEPRKGLLFMLVGMANFAVLLFIALSTQFLHLMKTFGQELNIRPNHQLMEALSTVQFGSAVANSLLFLFLCFTAFSMRDAFDRALLLRKRAIYATDAMQISEASSGSYLFHIALMVTILILSFFFLIPPAPRQQVTEIEFVQPDEKTHEKVHTRNISPVTSKAQRDPKINRTTKDPHSPSAESKSQQPPSQQAQPPRPQQQVRRVSTPTQPQRQQNQQQAKTNPALTQSTTPPAPAPRVQTPTPPRPVPVPQRAIGSTPAPPTVQPPKIATAINPMPQPQNVPAPVLPGISTLMPMGAKSHTATNSVQMPGPSNIQTRQGLAPGPVVSDRSGGLQSARPGIFESINTATGPNKGPRALKDIGSQGGPTHGTENAPGPTGRTPGTKGGPQYTPIAPTSGPANDSKKPGADTGTNSKPQMGSNPLTGVEGRPSPDSKPPKEPDWLAYMADLQRRIKRSWFPPHGPESNRIKVTFTVFTNGTMTGMKLKQSSGSALADQAAMKAIQNAAPFRPLPEGAPPSADIEFTFDFNVFHGTGTGSGRLF